MSYDDFCRLSPEEFMYVCKAYAERRESKLHDDWERMRLLATITIQPHVKGKISPDKLLPLPWEKKPKAEAPKVSKEEAMKRFERLAGRG